MFELKKVKAIKITYSDLSDLLGGRTGNPLAEGEVPAYLSEAIDSGVPVFVIDETGAVSYRLLIEGGKFIAKAGD